MSRLTYIVAASAFFASAAKAEANYTYLPSNQTRTSIPFAATYCAGQFDNLLGPTTTGFGASLSSSCLSSILQNCNSYVAEYPVTTYFPNISSPCCGNQCDIWAVTARVLYWPTPAVSPNITSYMDEKGFTFISPSPYVIFANMTAENPCGYQGSFVSATTVAFRPDELSTWANGDYNGSIQALNYADLSGCPQTYNSDSPILCLPYLAFGTRLSSTFQPAWSTCSFRDPILADPPYALIPAMNLLPRPTSADPVTTATPASSATYVQPLPIQTQSSIITAMALSTEIALMASTSSSLPQDLGQPFRSIDPPVPNPSDTVVQDGTTTPTAFLATATAEITTSGSGLDNVVIAGQTFTPGATAIISGTIVSILPEPSQIPQPARVTVAGVVYTANSQSNFVIGSQTYAPGAIVTISGTPVSIPQDPSSSPLPVKLTIAGVVYTANSQSNFIIGTQTFAPGATATVSGSLVTAPTASPQPDPKIFTFASSTYTANSLSNFVIGSQTLVPGGVVTVSGTPISLAAAGQTDAVVGTSTQMLGSVILGMFNTPAPSETAGGGAVNGSYLFTGDGKRVVAGGGCNAAMRIGISLGVGAVWTWALRSW